MSDCGCEEMLKANGLDKRVKVVVNGVCQYCGTKQCSVCKPEPDKFIAVDNVYNPHCSKCGRNLLENSLTITMCLRVGKAP